MPKYFTLVGFILAVLVTTTTTLPVKRKDHDVEAFSRVIHDTNPGVVHQIAANPSGKDMPTISEEEVMKFTDPKGNKPELVPTTFRVPTPPPMGTKKPDPSVPGKEKGTDKKTTIPGAGKETPDATPSLAPCDPFYNGTHLVCRTPPKPSSKPEKPQHKEGTDKPCIPGVDAAVGGCKKESRKPHVTASCGPYGSGHGCQKSRHADGSKDMSNPTHSHPAGNTHMHTRNPMDKHDDKNKHTPVRHPEPSNFPRPTSENHYPHGPTHPPRRPSTQHAPPMAPVDPFSQLMKQMACFPANSMVQMENGAAKRMSEVEVGDRVLTSCGTYSTVFAFSHRDSTIVSHFVRFDTASGHSLQLSPGHYISINGVISAAGTARVGDTLVLGNGATTTITRYSMMQNIGLFNPQTLDGNVVVDGVVATTFTVAVKPTAARALLAPLALVYRVFGMDMIGDTMVSGGHNAMKSASKMFLQ